MKSTHELFKLVKIPKEDNYKSKFANTKEFIDSLSNSKLINYLHYTDLGFSKKNFQEKIKNLVTSGKIENSSLLTHSNSSKFKITTHENKLTFSKNPSDSNFTLKNIENSKLLNYIQNNKKISKNSIRNCSSEYNSTIHEVKKAQNLKSNYQNLKMKKNDKSNLKNLANTNLSKENSMKSKESISQVKNNLTIGLVNNIKVQDENEIKKTKTHRRNQNNLENLDNFYSKCQKIEKIKNEELKTPNIGDTINYYLFKRTSTQEKNLIPKVRSYEYLMNNKTFKKLAFSCNQGFKTSKNELLKFKKRHSKTIKKIQLVQKKINRKSDQFVNQLIAEDYKRYKEEEESSNEKLLIMARTVKKINKM